MSLFGNLGGSSTSSQPPRPAFSFLNAQSTATQQSGTTSSLFGGQGGSAPQASQPPAATGPSLGGSIFGGGGPGATTQADPGASLRGASLFGSLLSDKASMTSAAAQGSVSAAQDQGAVSKGENLQPAFFNSLLERGKKNASGLGDSFGARSSLGPLPHLQLGLSDIASRARELGRGSRASAGDSLGGGSLLGASVTTVTGRAPESSLRLSRAPEERSVRFSNLPDRDSKVPAKPLHPDPLELDNEKFVRGIQQRSRQAMIEENFARTQRDFDAYMEESMDLNWDEQRKRIYEHFGLAGRLDEQDDSLNFSKTNKGSFGRSTRRGRNQGVNGASVGPAAGRSLLNRSAMEESVIGTPGMGSSNAALFSDATERNGNVKQNVVDGRFVREREEGFAQRVGELNEARTNKICYPVIHEFSIVESNSGGETSGPVSDAYSALVSITGEQPEAVDSSRPGILKERQFAKAYLNEKQNNPESMTLRSKIIDGSRRFLERQFYREVEESIKKNPHEAQLGGVPTTINRMRAYIRIQAYKKYLVADEFELQTIGDSDLCWVLIFYLLRCGFVKEAADYVAKEPAFRSVDRNFITYMTAYANSVDRRLHRSLQEKINAEYQQRSRNNPEHSVDPYRLACYKIIGRCELSRRTLDNLPPKLEDWIWLQFSMAREVNRAEEIAGEVFGLNELRQSIVEIGQRHFKSLEPSAEFGTFFLLQVLGGMFEAAIEFLYKYNYVSAVHFAIALDYYGLLRVSDFYTAGGELLTNTTTQLAQINFDRMIGYYTRDFRSGNAEAAVDYLTLICLNSDLDGALGESQSKVCHEALRELVLETREFAQLLGDIRADGTRVKGAIEKRINLIKLSNQEEYLNAVTIQAAAVADDSGRTTDAVLLYHLAEDYDNVIAIINRAMSEAISVDLGEAPLRLQPLKPRTATASGQQTFQQLLDQEGSSLSLTSVEDPATLARNMITLYNSNALYYQQIKQNNRDACGVLIQIMEIRNRVEAEEWGSVLDMIDNLGILPLRVQTPNNRTPYIRSVATSFSSLPPVVARTVGQLLIWTITAISYKRGELLSAQYEDAMRVQMAERLLGMAKDLMVFAGLVRYKLPPRVFETLAKAGMDAGAYAY